MPNINDYYTCGMCGHRFSEEERVETCSRCSLLGVGGCSKIRCPKCQYEMAPPARLPKYIEKITKKLRKKN